MGDGVGRAIENGQLVAEAVRDVRLASNRVDDNGIRVAANGCRCDDRVDLSIDDAHRAIAGASGDEECW